MSWEPLNLRHLDEQPSVEPTLCGLIYLGGPRHAFTGPPESAKTIAAHAVALEHVRDGGGVLLVDLEMGARDTRDRLREMGATDDDLDRLVYVEPDTPAGPDTVAELIDRFSVQLAIIDAAAGAYSLHGLDDNRRGDVETFSELLIAPLRARGISSIVIDHVVKKPRDRARWAIGSERKLGFSDVSLGFSPITPLTRGGEGLVRIETHKDRHGHLPRPNAAELFLRSDPDTHQIAWEWREAQTQEDTDAWRPTGLMERVSKFLEGQPEPVSRRNIEAHVEGKTDYVRAAIGHLVTDGYVVETEGRYRPLRSERPFRVDGDVAAEVAPRFAQDAPRARSGTGERVRPVPLPPGAGRGEAPTQQAPAEPDPDDDAGESGPAHDSASAEPVQAVASPCRFPAHRGADWLTDDGRIVCGICHPPAGPRV